MTVLDYCFFVAVFGWAVSYNNVLRFDKNYRFHIASVIIYGVLMGLAIAVKLGAFTQ